MSERPKDGADPDATVMMPARGPDPDATVMIPARGPDPDATVMIPASGPDPDATVAVTPAAPGRADDPEATIAIPTPGRRRDSEAPAMPQGAVPQELGSLGGLNPLIEAANPILAVVPQIRQALKHSDPSGLRSNLREKLDAFEAFAQAAGASADGVRTASFALCTLVDESAASTPWGADWALQGLLSERHHESDGGERFFTLLADLSADPAGNLHLLEFFFVCLGLGLEGKYRSLDGGRQALAEQRGILHDLIRAQRPPHDGELSGKWRGVAAPLRKDRGALALWLAGSTAALVLAGLYLAFSASLAARSDPVARDLAQLKAAGPGEPAAPRDAATPAIGRQLAAEIGRGEVAVTDSAGKSTIVIRGDQFFASGSARLEPQVEPVIARIAEALERVPGTIVVTGHTDDVPIRTARFPSNWELSTERAASVVKLMAGKLADPRRLRAEGLADSEPVAPNDTAANRARNRRVVIILRSAP